MDPRYAARIRECETAIRTINGQINDNNREKSRSSELQNRLSHALNRMVAHEKSIYDLTNNLWLNKDGAESWRGQKKDESNNLVSVRVKPLTENHARFLSEKMQEIRAERQRLENVIWDFDRSINALSRNRRNLEVEIERLRKL